MIPIINTLLQYQSIYKEIYDYCDAFSYCYDHQYITLKFQEDVDLDISYAKCDYNPDDLGSLLPLFSLPVYKSWYSKKYDATKINAYDSNDNLIISIKIKNGWNRLRYSTTFMDTDRNSLIASKEAYVSNINLEILFTSFLLMKKTYENIQERVRRILKAYIVLQGEDRYWDKISFTFNDEYFQKIVIKKKLQECSPDFINYVAEIDERIYPQICYIALYQENSSVIVDPEQEIFCIKFSYNDEVTGIERFLFTLQFINYNEYNAFVKYFEKQ